MENYSKRFIKARAKVMALEEKLSVARKKLEAACPHVTLSGESTFPDGRSFTNCTLCGISSRNA